MFGIGCVNLLLLKSLQFQCANTHESKEEVVILTSNNLFPCFHQKSFIHGWLQNDVIIRQYNFVSNGTCEKNCLDKLTFQTMTTPLYNP